MHRCPPLFPLRKEHASELNAVLINNRLAHADLLGRMEKEDFAFGVGVRRWRFYETGAVPFSRSS